MAPSPAVLSELYLRAVLPCLAELAIEDARARELVGAVTGSITLRVLGGPATTIHLQAGVVLCETIGRHNASVTLLFVSRKHLNAFFAGRSWAAPIPVWGAWRIKLLSRFSKLAKRLEAVLDGQASVLESAAGRRLHARLTLMTAALGLVPLARSDELTRHVLRSVPLGLASFSIAGEPRSTAWFDHGASQCVAGWGDPPRPPEVCVSFNSIDTAFVAMRDEIDSIAAVVTGQIKIDGLVPLADGLSAVMRRLRVYLGS